MRAGVRSNPAAWRALPRLPLLLLLAGAAGIGYTVDDLSVGSLKAMLPGSGCRIKGNVSIETGTRIYHVPGQKYYDSTIVRPQYGERWFCSEAEARAAGWRRSRV